MVKVNVLLSTYNGEKYLRTLIDSILNQKGVIVDLLVRDDGSSDKTQEILDYYQRKGKLKWHKGENLKPARSFMQLLKESNDADYYAFADQDDFWLPNKLIAGIKSLLQKDNKPALYFCKTKIVDESLNEIKTKEIKPYLTFGEALVYRFVSGCTMIFNRELRKIINSYKPNFLSMHDIWIYCIAQSIGAKVVYDSHPYILYRQHANNTIGENNNFFQDWKRRLQRVINNKQIRYKVAEELRNGYYPLMKEDNKKIINDFILSKISLRKRIQLLGDKRFLCGDKRTYNFFRFALLINTY